MQKRSSARRLPAWRRRRRDDEAGDAIRPSRGITRGNQAAEGNADQGHLPLVHAVEHFVYRARPGREFAFRVDARPELLQGKRDDSMAGLQRLHRRRHPFPTPLNAGDDDDRIADAACDHAATNIIHRSMPRLANAFARTCGSLAVAAYVLQASAVAQAPQTGFDAAALNRIDAVVADAIEARQLPGAVVVVGRGDQVAFRKAYGQRAVQPSAEPMTLDTIFDLASLTKVVATTPSVMMLVEQGRIRLTDPVASFIPEFAKYGKDRITVRDLMTHMSGLRPDVDLGDPWVGLAGSHQAGD